MSDDVKRVCDFCLEDQTPKGKGIFQINDFRGNGFGLVCDKCFPVVKELLETISGTEDMKFGASPFHTPSIRSWGDLFDTTADRNHPRTCYFTLETERTPAGSYIPCIAKEGETGYWRTDWSWNCSKEQAQELADEMNSRLGISKRFAMIIQLRSMRKPVVVEIHKEDS